MEALAFFSSAISETAKTVPSLVLFSIVLGGLVHVFLKHLHEERIARDKTAHEEREARQAMDNARAKSLESLGDNCHQFQRELSKEVRAMFNVTHQHLEKNTAAMSENTVVLRELSQRLMGEREHA